MEVDTATERQQPSAEASEQPDAARPLRALLLEDDPNDAELILHELRKLDAGITSQRVDSHVALERSLKEFAPDVVLLDYKLPAFDGTAALKIVRQLHPEIPAVIVTGAIGDQAAIELLKAGAKDYVLKSDLARLRPAVQYALLSEQDARARTAAEKATLRSELRYRRLFEASEDGILIFDAKDGGIVDINPFLTTNLGFTREELLGKPLWDIGMFTDQEASKKAFSELQTRGRVRYDNLKLRRRDGTSLDVEFVSNAYDVNGQRLCQCNIRDISERLRASKNLLAAEKKYGDLFESTRDAILVVEPDSGRFLAANNAAIRLYGAKDEAELINQSPSVRYPERQPDGRMSAEKAREMIDVALRKGSSFFEWTLRLPGGAECPTDVLLTKVARDEKILLYATVRDISERKRTEKDRTFDAAVLAAIQQASPDGIFLVDQHEKIVNYNQRFAEIWALPSELLATKLDPPILQAVASCITDESIFLDRVKALYKDREARSHDEIRLKDGRVLDRFTVPVNLDDGTYIGRVWFFRDITERVHIQDELQTAHEHLQSATEGASAGVWSADFRTQKMIGDATVRLLHGIRKTDPFPDVSGWLALVYSDDRSAFQETLAAGMAGKLERIDFEYRVPMPDGSLRWLRSFGRVILDESGVAKRATGISLDITAAKQIQADKDRAEANVTASERRFRAMIENTSDIITVTDAQGVLTYVSPAMQVIAGYAPEDVLGHSVLEFVDPDSIEDLKVKFAAIVHQHGRISRAERNFLCKDGQLRLFDVVYSNLLQDPAIGGIVVNMRDVTERARAERDLKLFRMLIDRSSDGIEVLEAETLRFIDMNEKACSSLGYNREELRSMTVFDIDPQFARLDSSAVDKLLNRPGSVMFESIYRRKDGSTFPVEVNTNRIQLDHAYQVAAVRDISERKAQEKALVRVNRALRALSACNSAVVRATTEQQILQEMCRAVVEIAGFKAAWVGFADQDQNKSVRPVAWAGTAAEYVHHLDISWADTERGRGPTGRCIRSATPQVTRDIDTDPRMVPWRGLTKEFDYASSLSLPLLGPTGVFGALMIYASERDAFGADELKLLMEMANDLSYGINARRTVIALTEGLRSLELSMEGTVHALAATVETRDPYTAGHQRRVAALAVAIAREMLLADHDIRGLELAASIHDIGKINVPAEILAKPGKLSMIEHELIKIHAEAGYQILKDVQFPWPVAEMIRQHHERLDGSGYPRGLKADQILKEAKILAVADVVEAMSSLRPYRQGKGIEAALEEITRSRGTQFDAQVVDACTKLFHESGFKIPD